jgi:hypothetical protein
MDFSSLAFELREKIAWVIGVSESPLGSRLLG